MMTIASGAALEVDVCGAHGGVPNVLEPIALNWFHTLRP